MLGLGLIYISSVIQLGVAQISGMFSDGEYYCNIYNMQNQDECVRSSCCIWNDWEDGVNSLYGRGRCWSAIGDQKCNDTEIDRHTYCAIINEQDEDECVRSSCCVWNTWGNGSDSYNGNGRCWSKYGKYDGDSGEYCYDVGGGECKANNNDIALSMETYCTVLNVYNEDECVRSSCCQWEEDPNAGYWYYHDYSDSDDVFYHCVVTGYGWNEDICHDIIATDEDGCGANNSHNNSHDIIIAIVVSAILVSAMFIFLYVHCRMKKEISQDIMNDRKF